MILFLPFVSQFFLFTRLISAIALYCLPTMTDFETTSVVICGCGPTGALLSAYLSRMSVQHVVLEKDTAITTDPRGIALDEDGIRLLQGVGIYDKIYTQIGACRWPLIPVPPDYGTASVRLFSYLTDLLLGMEQFHFIGGSKKALDQRPFLQMDYATVSSPNTVLVNASRVQD